MSDDVKRLRDMVGNLPRNADEYTAEDIHVANIIVDQWLAEHPADSDEVIDQGFLMDFGFRLTEPSASVVIWKLGELWLVCTALGNEWKWNGYLIESWPKTRGDLRRLCAALGIPLEQPK